MTNFNSIDFLIIILINIIGIVLALMVYYASPKNRVNQLTVFWIFPTLFYIDFGYFANYLKIPEYSLLLMRLRFVAVSLFFITGYCFYNYFPDKNRIKTSLLNFFYFATWIVMIIISISTSLVIEEIKIIEIGTKIIFGRAIITYFVWTTLSIFLIFFILFRKYFLLLKEDKLKVQYFIVGAALFAIFNLFFNVVLPSYRHSMQYYQFGDYSAIFLLGFTAYAIVKHNLFGIKVVLTALFAVAMGITLLIQIFIAPTFGWKITDGVIFILFCVFAYYLVKATQGEEARRQNAESMAIREGALRQRAERLTEEFKKLDDNKTQFMLATQHHLRTPLTAIQGYLSMLYEGSWGKINEAAKSKIKSAFESTQKLIKLVNEFLDIAQFEVGKESIVKKEINLEAILKEVIAEVKPIAEQKALYLKFEAPNQSLRLGTGSTSNQNLLTDGFSSKYDPNQSIMADPEKIKEAIYNIVLNSIKYTKEGGVIIKFEKTDGKILIAVKDTGIGIEKAEIEGLFQKTFSRGEQAKKIYTTGRGIGLYLSFQIVKAHKGRIWAESPGRDKGATFYIELPIDGNDLSR